MAQNATEMENTELQYVLDQLQARKGSWPQIEKDTGLDYSWLSKLSRGLIEDPGIKKIAKAARYFRLLEQHERERAALSAPAAVSVATG